MVATTIGSQERAVTNYLAGLVPHGDLAEQCEFVTAPPLRSIAHILRKVEAQKRPRLLLMPTSRGDYSQIAREIEQWGGSYPQEIVFYHLDAGDFAYFRQMPVKKAG